MNGITEELLQKFLKKISKGVQGDWVILGGAVLPLLGLSHRVTVDIDLARVKSGTNQDQLELMKMAESIGLPVEAVNTAAEYFLKKIDAFEDSLVLVQSSKGFKLYRPNINLFIQLKLSRLSPTDLEDCLVVLKHRDELGDLLEAKRLIQIVAKEIKKHDHRVERLQQLLDAIKESSP